MNFDFADPVMSYTITVWNNRYGTNHQLEELESDTFILTAKDVPNSCIAVMKIQVPNTILFGIYRCSEDSSYMHLARGSIASTYLYLGMTSY
jgi:hypothetical protein